MTFSSHASLRALLLGAIGCQAASSDGPTKSTEVSELDILTATLCLKPTPVLLKNGEPTGFVKCADGAINRVEAVPFKAVNTAQRCGGEVTGGHVG